LKTRFSLIPIFFISFVIHAASSIDSTFDPGTGANGIVEQALPLPDGKILICGNFTQFNGRNHAYIARLNSNGSVDETFNGQPSYWVRHMVVQSDGKIVIAGYFTRDQAPPILLREAWTETIPPSSSGRRCNRTEK